MYTEDSQNRKAEILRNIEMRARAQQRKAEILRNIEMRAQKSTEQEPQSPLKNAGGEYGWGERAGQVLRGVAGVLGSISDIAVEMGPGHPLYAPQREESEIERPEVPYSKQAQGIVDRAYGRDLSPVDVKGKFLQGAGEFLSIPTSAPFKGVSAAVKSAPTLLSKIGSGLKGASKYIGKESALAGSASAATHLTPRITEEGTIPGTIEDISKAALGHGAARLAMSPSAFVKPFSSEKKVSEKLRHFVGGEEEAQKIAQRLKDYESPIGYQPLTAEIAENPDLAILQRTQTGVVGSGIAQAQGKGNEVIRGAIKRSIPEEAKVEDLISHVGEGIKSNERAIESAKGAFDKRASAGESGRAIQKDLEDKIARLSAERYKETHPLYEEVKKSQERFKPSETSAFIREELKTAKGDIKSDLERALKDLSPNALGGKRDVALESLIEEYRKKGVSEGAINQILKNAEINPTIGELQGARKSISSRIESLKTSGEKQRAYILEQALEKLDEDMSAFPLAKKAKELYREKSIPISEITEHQTLGRASRKDIYGKDFKLNESSVPEIFINASEGSSDNVRDLMKHIKPETKNILGEYINERAMSEILDPLTGDVSLQKIESFKKKHKSLAPYYPEIFDTKLKNISNAKLASNQYYKKTQAVSDIFEKNAFDEWVPRDEKRIGKKLFNDRSARNAEDMVDSVKADKSGAALNGLRRYSSDYFLKSIENAGIEGTGRTLSYPKMSKFIGHHEGALKKIFDENQFKVIKEVEKIMEGRQKAQTMGVSSGSPTRAYGENANIMNLVSGASGKGLGFILPGWAKDSAKKLYSFVEKAAKKGESEILNRALVDKDYAALLLETPLKDKASLSKFNKMVEFGNISAPSVLKNIKQQNKEE